MNYKQTYFKDISNLDELIKVSNEKEEDAWTLLYTNSTLDSKNSDALINRYYEEASYESTGGEVVEDFYFDVTINTFITVKSLAVVLENAEVMNKDMSYSIMKKHPEYIIPTTYKFLKSYLEEDEIRYVVYPYAYDLLGLENERELEEYMNMLNLNMHIYPSAVVEGEIINIKLVVTSYDDSDNQSIDQLKI